MIEKRLHLWGLIFSLVVCILLLGESTSFCQSQNPSSNKNSSDTNAIKKQKQGTFSFIKHLFLRTDKKPSNNSTQNKGKSKGDTLTAKNQHKSEPLELTKGSITWTSLYTQGVNLNTGISGLYSIGRLSQGFDVFGAPINMVGTGVFNDGQFEKSYSGYSVNFGPEAYLNGLRKRAENILLNKRSSGKCPNLSDSLSAYESLREKLQSPSYQSDENACKSQFKRDNDSAMKHPGSDTYKSMTIKMQIGNLAIL